MDGLIHTFIHSLQIIKSKQILLHCKNFSDNNLVIQILILAGGEDVGSYISQEYVYISEYKEPNWN